MEQFLIFALVNFGKSLFTLSPAVVDLLKLLMGSVFWIGSLVGYMYWRERKLRPATNK